LAVKGLIDNILFLSTVAFAQYRYITIGVKTSIFF